MDICHSDKWPGQVVIVVDALDLSKFGWEPCYRMEAADSTFNTEELVDIVNCFL